MSTARRPGKEVEGSTMQSTHGEEIDERTEKSVILDEDALTDQHTAALKEEKLQKTRTRDGYSASFRSIFMVPSTLRDANTEAYTPLILEINPQGGKEKLDFPYKMNYVSHFLRRAERNNMDFLSLLKEVNGHLPKILEHYSDSINPIKHLNGMPREQWEKGIYDFTKRIIINSAFLIELSRRHTYQHHPTQDDDLPLCPEVTANINEIIRDILLLENQLPFFIVEKLYQLVYRSSDLREIMSHFIGLKDWGRLAQNNETESEKRERQREREEVPCCHLLDLVWRYYEPSDGAIVDIEDINRRYIVSPTATTLYEAGVKFEVAPPRKKWKLLELHFDKFRGILIIPKLYTEYHAASLFKNMIAYEQFMDPVNGKGKYISDYLYFLDCLIDNPRDVQLLADAGIIENCFGPEEVCDMFNGISKNCIDTWNYRYADLSDQLIDHCKYNWNRHKATLKNKYFGHPWAAISVVYATILLILTIIQVIAGILAVPGVLK